MLSVWLQYSKHSQHAYTLSIVDTACIGSQYSEFFVSLLGSGEWSKPVTSGAPPSPRQGHVAAMVGSKLFIHGGMAGQDIKEDLFCLDLGQYIPCPKIMFSNSYQLDM